MRISSNIFSLTTMNVNLKIFLALVYFFVIWRAEMRVLLRIELMERWPSG